ncbi:MAG: HEAT repeat domain-containing protein [Phycisphaerae bacterium]|nr:HEAT repeat domain-containing protein [Phycisphaerae bacterium]
MLPSITDGFGAVQRSNRRLVAVLVVLALACTALLVFRYPLWARWWGHRLVQTNDSQERLGYVLRLAALGEASVPVAADLLEQNDVELRSFGVFLLSRVNSPVSTRHLRRAVDDADADLRRMALQEYARRPDPEVAAELVRRLDDPRPDVVGWAAVGLATDHLDAGLAALTHAARSHADAGVRVQAIQALALTNRREPVDALIDCLEDGSRYTGWTAIDASAARAIRSAGGRSASFGAEDSADASDTPPEYIVGQEADRALRALTGVSFDYQVDDPEARQKAIAAWREWLATSTSSGEEES